MKKIITLSVACMALVFASAFAAAQDGGKKNTDDKGKGQIGQQLKQKREGMQKLLQSLNLTEEQKTKIKEIMKKSREDIKEVMKGEGEKKDKAAKVKAIRKETLEAIRGVLTDEQKTKFDEYVKKQEEKGPGKKGKKK
jgi:Spy/CpxP family protein refolding chaperone